MKIQFALIETSFKKIRKEEEKAGRKRRKVRGVAEKGVLFW